MNIQSVDSRTLHDIINTRQPHGLYLAHEGRVWVAVDNSDGNAWTEEFRWKFQAVQWLTGKSEVS